MLAAVYHGRGNVRIESVPKSPPASDELFLEIHAAGICGSDAAGYASG
jgi:(R,R)-butanediol dehydrogenase/meso-butanediol dehydrogenase/diacetyl reductase